MGSDIWRLSATEMLGLIRSKCISRVELLQEHLSMVDRCNGGLNAVVAIDSERALRAAADADDRAQHSSELGRLDGLPITVKDGWAVAGFPSTNGDPGLRDHVPTVDAGCVALLRRAGVVIFGKTNVPIHCADAQTYNEIYGLTRNPWDPSRSPGGSSGGAAAAVSAGLTALEIGSDIAGSIRVPAAWCGIYGMKTSFGLIPTRGHLPDHILSQRDMNVPGPMARSADDLALALDVLLDQPAGRQAERVSGRLRLSDFSATVGVVGEPFGTDATTSMIIGDRIGALGKAGLQLRSPVRLAYEQADLMTYYRLLTASVFVQQKQSTRAAPSVEGSDRAAQMITAMRDGAHLTHEDWLRDNERRHRCRAWFDVLLRAVDLLLLPSVSVAAPTHDTSEPASARIIDIDGAKTPFYSVCDWVSLASYLYLPAISLPAGINKQGLPVGLQVIAGYGRDRMLAEFAQSYERHFGRPDAPPHITTENA